MESVIKRQEKTKKKTVLMNKHFFANFPKLRILQKQNSFPALRLNHEWKELIKSIFFHLHLNNLNFAIKKTVFGTTLMTDTEVLGLRIVNDWLITEQ